MVEACKNNHVDVVEVLRNHVGELDAFHISEYEGESNTTATPLSIASERGCLEGVKLLVEMGASIDAPIDDYCGGTALVSACGAGRVEVVQFLLGSEASARSMNNQGETALLSACGSYRSWIPAPLITLLVEHGADINAVCGKGRSVLMRYAIFCHVETATLRLLLDYGADVTFKNSYGETVFTYLQSKEALSAEERQGFTALCKQYEESNRRVNATTAPTLK